MHENLVKPSLQKYYLGILLALVRQCFLSKLNLFTEPNKRSPWTYCHYYRRPPCLTGERHAWLETDLPHRRQIGLRHASSKPTYLIRDQHAWSDTDMYNRRPISLIGDRNAMSVSNGSPMRHVRLRWVSDKNNNFINSIKSKFE